MYSWQLGCRLWPVGPGADGNSFFCETVIYFIGDAPTAIVAGDFTWSVISRVLCIVSFIPVAMHDHFANTTLTMTQFMFFILWNSLCS
jgi:hypothetical protein